MVGMGMIFDETYRPFFEHARAAGLYDRRFGDVNVELTAVATRTGKRAEAYRDKAGDKIHAFESFAGDGLGRSDARLGARFCLCGHSRRPAF